MATGVYAIRNAVNGKVYVGSAAVSLKDRWRSHRKELRRGKHCNRYLQFAWNKHGEPAFEFTVLEECDPGACIAREQHWIDEKRAADHSFGYNISPTAGSPLGVKHTPETRAKVAAAQRGRKYGPEFGKAVSEGLKGRNRHFNEAWRKAISEARKGKPKSEEHRRKMSEANRRRWAARRQRLGLGEKPPSSIGTTAICSVCCEPFVKRTSHVKTCGIACRKRAERQRAIRRQKSYPVIACVICGSEFRPRRHTTSTCSPECGAERDRRRKRKEPT
jgi:group I intron endonuclease